MKRLMSTVAAVVMLAVAAPGETQVVDKKALTLEGARHELGAKPEPQA